MKARYKREMRHNYLILDAFLEDMENFEIRMLAGNSIEGILKFRVKQEEQKPYYYYEITSKQPLDRLLELKEIRKEELSRLIAGIGTALSQIETYLLQESHILLEPEYIYVEQETFKIWLCYVPGYQGDFPAAMGKLLQFCLKRADHQDHDTVVLAYRLYQESQKDYYGIDDLLKIVQEGQKRENPKIGQSLKKERRDIFEEPVPDGEARDYWIQDEESGDETEQNRISEDKGQLRKEPEGKEDFWLPEKKNSRKKKMKKNRKNEVKSAAFTAAAFAAAVPAAVWLYAGEEGILRYRFIIGAADAGALLILLLFLLKIHFCSRGEKKIKKNSGQELKKEKWYMTFEEKEEEENTGHAAWNDELEETQGNRESGEEREKDETVNSQNTVLLAEAQGIGKKSHILKSLDPQIEDIPVLYFPFIIGKQDGIVDYLLKRDTVSRLHLRIDDEKGNCRITDLNSSNGTVVAGRILEANESCPIHCGDKIQIADLSFIFY